MKFTCKKASLVQGLQIVSKAIPSKPQMPLLSGIYLKAENDILEMQATDYEISALCRIDAQIETSGSIVLSGRYFQEVIRRMPNEDITISYQREQNITKITSDASNFTLLNMDAGEYPTITRLESDFVLHMSTPTLRNLLKKIVFSCSTDESRPIFTGCYLETNEDILTMAATNTHRLSVKTETLENPVGNIKAIIPAKILNELLRLLSSDLPTDIAITCSLNQISFQFDQIYLSSRLIEGQFPNYQKVIPSDFNIHVQLPTHEFLSAVDRVSLISRTGEYNIIRLEFANNQVRISSNNPDIGNAEETLPATIDGEDIHIAFNAQYVTDVLKNINSDHFRFEMIAPLKPAMIRDEDDETFTYIVTPVRTTS